jgi:hypothetical protein
LQEVCILSQAISCAEPIRTNCKELQNPSTLKAISRRKKQFSTHLQIRAKPPRELLPLYYPGEEKAF